MPHQPRHIPEAILDHCLPAIAAGKTGLPQQLASGGAPAIGKIVFTNNLAPGETVTINGVVFTCENGTAAGAVQFNVGVSLSASLDALVSVANLSTDPLVSGYTYTKTDTASALTATSDAMAASANIAGFFASNHATVVITQPVGGSNIVTASLDTEHTQFSIPTTLTHQVNLDNGDETQRKTFTQKGLGTVNLKVPSSAFFGATVNWSIPTGASLGLMFTNGKWAPTFNNGCTAS